MVEHFVHSQGGAALTCVQHAGVHCKGAGDLDAVHACNAAGLFHGEHLHALLGCHDTCHKACCAAANDGHIHIVFLSCACGLFHSLGQPCLTVAACLRNTVCNGFLDSAAGIGSTGNAVHAACLIVQNGGDQLVLHLTEQRGSLVLAHDLHIGQRSLREGALQLNVGDIAVSLGGVGAGLEGKASLGSCACSSRGSGGGSSSAGSNRACRAAAAGQHTGSSSADGTGSSLFQEVATGNAVCHDKVLLYVFFLLRVYDVFRSGTAGPELRLTFHEQHFTA